MKNDIIIGIDAGTSLMKSIAFDLSGKQIAVASIPNSYDVAPGGAVTQSLDRTWQDCAASLRDLAAKVPDLAARVAAISVTGQGDGTWLVGKDNQPVGDGWLWLDSRAGQLAEELSNAETDMARFLSTGTGLNACQQGVQLAYMKRHMPEQIAQAETALHCKDWLYLNLTGIRATDPSEGCFTFGNFLSRQYNGDVIDALGLTDQRTLLPEMIDGSVITHGLTQDAANLTGLRAGTPVSLGFVDVVCTALGAGAYQKDTSAGCTIVGTTGMHVKSTAVENIGLDAKDRTGYVMLMPIPGIAIHLQTNMASTLNIDWVLGLASDVMGLTGAPPTKESLLALMDVWLRTAKPAELLYHPYISDAGERGPFIDHTARASLIGLDQSHGFAELARAVVEGLGMAARDCYTAMGTVPQEVCLTGGAARSQALRGVLAACLGTNVRQSMREEAGAAGAAMMASVAIGAYENMEDCVSKWVTPLLGQIETPKAQDVERYASLFPQYKTARKALEPIWHGMSQRKGTVT